MERQEGVVEGFCPVKNLFNKIGQDNVDGMDTCPLAANSKCL